jgi:magnesium-transporting ATPase (P-type)
MADIKVWMLTGDKFETAENIAASCKLIDCDQENVNVIRVRTPKDVETLCKNESFEEKVKLI